ncbi:rhamnogalacturonan acetylesterase [Asticcacaulis solisilvae]|uniref:rhamnogalacturonan acetylesterase n=1 Tax=Asticcacaulis solisilvae TaxID=1217274 RepID=UPI003FD8A77A
MKKAILILAAGLAVALPAAAQIQPTIVPAPVVAQLPAVTDAAQRAAIKRIVPKKIILVGDSTTQVGSGWGGSFCANHLTSFVSCVNLARGGRGTFDYRAEGSWDIALSEMKAPGYAQVYVLIQFGHNDQPGKPGRSTDLATEYPANLKRYVTEARAAGAIPVLVTPLTRRAFKNGSLQDDLQPWAEAVKSVAKEMDVPLVDLHALSVAAVQQMGPVEAITLAETMPPQEVIEAAKTGTTIGAPKTTPAAPAASTEVLEKPQGHPTVVFDYTHLGPKGADYVSKMVTVELARVVPDLRRDLVEDLYPPHQ